LKFGKQAMLKCILCTKSPKTEDYKCDVVGCKAKKEQNCTHNNDKCADCKGNYIAKSNVYPKEQEAIWLAMEARTIGRERLRERKNIHQIHEVPQEMEWDSRRREENRRQQNS
jgi:hypothetical protein